MEKPAIIYQSILDNPDDDRPRLDFADWAAANGQPDRGEFIRVQCRLAQLPENDPARKPLEAREKELLGNPPLPGMAPEWTRRREWLNLPKNWPIYGWRFERGFPCHLYMEPLEFISKAPDIFSRIPLQSLRLNDGVALVKALAASPLLARLRNLQVIGRNYFAPSWGPCTQGLHYSPLSAVLDSPFLAGLRELHWHVYSRIDAEHLLATPILRQLRLLNLSGNRLEVDAVTKLLASACFAGIQELRLAGYFRTDSDLYAIHILDCMGCTEINIGEAGIIALAQAPAAAQLRTLDIRFNHLGEAGIKALIESPYLRNLECLRVSEPEDFTCSYPLQPPRGSRLHPELLEQLRKRFCDNLTVEDLVF